MFTELLNGINTGVKHEKDLASHLRVLREAYDQTRELRAAVEDNTCEDDNTCEHCGEYEPEGLRSWECFYGGEKEGCVSCYEER